jgi:dienelactone hydrolase
MMLMKVTRLGVLSSLLAVLLPLCAVAAPPAEAFFADPVFSDARLSPDGNKVAMLVGAKGAFMKLAVVDLNSMKAAPVTAFDDHDVRSAIWVNDKRLLFYQKPRAKGLGVVDVGSGMFAINADGTGSRILMSAVRYFVTTGGEPEPTLKNGSYLIEVPARTSGDEVFVAAPDERSREKFDYFNVQRLNTANGRVADIEAPLHSRHWVFDSKGSLRAVMTYQDDTTATLIKQDDGSWKKVSEFKGLIGNRITPTWVAPDGTLYAQAGRNGMSALFVMDAQTGKLKEPPVAASKDFSLHPSFIANDKKLLGLRYTVDAEVTQWLDAPMQALQTNIDKLLPATSNRITPPRHGDSPWVLVEAFADVQPTLTYVYNRDTAKLTRLGAALPGIDRREMGQTDFFRIKARDGLEIPVYLTLPPGGGKNHPLVVLVHGGPWVRGGHWAFDPEVQFLASRGYAVLQPEFRGSQGFGVKHFEAGFKQWGRAMQDDVADATRWAISQGHADGQRVCIAGASYGGYAVLMGLAREADLYRCGVNWVGVTDPSLLFSRTWSDITEESKRYGLARMIGDPDADADMLKAVSPIENAAKIKQPLLMAYGAWDTRVPLVHGERMRDALKPHNKNVEWVVYDKEGHGWSKPETRVDFWNRVEKFLATHIAKP